MKYITTIDINCDLGEGMGNEALIMAYISSCNIACGGHAGDEDTVLEVVKLAKAHNVKVGAHPAFPDRENFGREVMAIDDRQLQKSLIKQIGIVQEVCKREGVKLNHVKPHGALYNLAARDGAVANLIIETLLLIDASLVLYVPFGSKIAALAKGKLDTFAEGFADRNYNGDYTLVSRKKANALLTQEKRILEHILPMILERKLVTKNGKTLPFQIDTLCVHGDNEKAIEIVEFLYQKLRENNIQIA